MRARLKSVEKTADRSILVKNDKMWAFYAPHHYHPHYEIIYIKKSFGIRIMGNHIGNYKEGEVVILGPGLPHFHAVGKVPDKDPYPVETIAVLFPESIFEQNRMFPEFRNIHRLLADLKYGIELTGNTKKEVQHILEEMSMEPTYANFVCIFRIFEILLKSNSGFFRLSSLKYDNKKLYNEKIKQILDYVLSNYQQAITVGDVSEAFEMSKPNFCILFKNQTQMTFSAYLNQLRISKACELIGTTQKNISEIAFEVGFENLAYFNRKFKEIKGSTPKQFRTSMSTPPC